MSDLKSEQKTVNIVEYEDLNDFISFHFGLPFDVISDQELNNYSYKLIQVQSSELSDWEQEYLTRLEERRDYPSGCLHTLMTDLCNRGFLAEGSYLIRVFW